MGTWLADLGEVRFDNSLLAARLDIGPEPDPSNAEHARRLRCWLNAWLCRLRYWRPGDPSDPFVTSLAAWWPPYENHLPRGERTLVGLNDNELEKIALAFEALRTVVVSLPNRRSRSLGPSAAAKVLYFLRPEAVTAWDAKIAGEFRGGRDGAAFLSHLTRCREWAKQIVAEAEHEGVSEAEIGLRVQRPHSSVAKLIDEYLYLVLTRAQEF